MAPARNTKSVMSNKKIIVALDGISEKEALHFARLFKGKVWGFKINDLLFGDIRIIRKLKRFGKVFADAKLYDIPNTVANGVARLSRAGADIITVHASGGVGMIKAAKRSTGRSKIVAVTVLTSGKAHNTRMMQLVREAVAAKVDGIVCSGRDLPLVSRVRGSRALLKVVPGIRPDWYTKKDDQKRSVTFNKAIGRGADFLVIGRPITRSKDPLGVLARITSL